MAEVNGTKFMFKVVAGRLFIELTILEVTWVHTHNSMFLFETKTYDLRFYEGINLSCVSNNFIFQTQIIYILTDVKIV